MSDFVSDIFRVGLFRSIVKHKDEIGIPEEVEAVISSDVDVLQQAIEDDMSYLAKDNQFEIGQFFDLWLKKNSIVDPDKLLDVGMRIQSSTTIDKDGDLMPYYVGKYFERHDTEAESVAERVLSNKESVEYVPRILPPAISANCDKWLPRLVGWISAQVDPHSQAIGLAALSSIDRATVETVENVDIVYTIADKLASGGNIDEIGVALYNASKTWCGNSKYRESFEDLRNGLVKSGNAKILKNVALTDRDEISSMSEDDISVRLRAFGDLLKSRETFNVLIDGYLAEVLKKKSELVIHLLERVMCDGDGFIFEDGILLQTFSAIALGDEGLKSRVITKWLLSSNIKLWHGAAKLVREIHRTDDIGIRVDDNQLPNDDISRINLFRRAVGWLFWAHLTCVGYAISCLEHLSAPSLSYVKPMFYDLLTMNFPDVVEKAVEIRTKSVSKDDLVLTFLNEQVLMRKRLEDSLSKAGVINELLPPVDDRIEYLKLESDRQRKIQGEARKRSLFGLFNCVTILYGNGMIGKQFTMDGEKRTVVPFERDDVKFRIPAMMHCAEVSLRSELEDARYLPVEAK